MCGDGIALATEREGAWRRRRSGLQSERLPGRECVVWLRWLMASSLLMTGMQSGTQLRIKSGDGFGLAAITASCDGGRRRTAGFLEMGSLDVQGGVCSGFGWLFGKGHKKRSQWEKESPPEEKKREER